MDLSIYFNPQLNKYCISICIFSLNSPFFPIPNCAASAGLQRQCRRFLLCLERLGSRKPPGHVASLDAATSLGEVFGCS
jgi:hypothetical protein